MARARRGLVDNFIGLGGGHGAGLACDPWEKQRRTRLGRCRFFKFSRAGCACHFSRQECCRFRTMHCGYNPKEPHFPPTGRRERQTRIPDPRDRRWIRRAPHWSSLATMKVGGS
eukprot:gene14938-biopygen2126